MRREHTETLTIKETDRNRETEERRDKQTDKKKDVQRPCRCKDN